MLVYERCITQRIEEIRKKPIIRRDSNPRHQQICSAGVCSIAMLQPIPIVISYLCLGYGGRITLSGKVAGSILASAVFFCVTCLDDLSQLINIQENGEKISLAALSVAFTR